MLTEDPPTRSDPHPIARRSARPSAGDDMRLRPGGAADRAYGWPIAWMCAGMALWYVLGVAWLAWVVPGVMFGLAILLRPSRFVAAPGTGVLLVFLGWVAMSVVGLGGGSGVVLFGYRFLLFVSMVAAYVWIWNAPRSELSSETISKWLASLWLTLVGFGWVAIVLGGFRTATPLLLVLPGAARKVSFLVEVAEFRPSELQRFLGYPVPRPSAPLPMTNGWGSTLGILTPFFVHSWLMSPDARRRRVGLVFIPLALVPAVVSLNRGLWISLGLSLVYVSVRRAAAGDSRMARKVFGGLVVLVLSVALTPLSHLVTDRVEGADRSNASRGSVYGEAVAGARRSPLLGHGAPLPQEQGPPVGTHGLIWYTMYCHGLVALGCLLWWFFGALIRSRSAPAGVGFWAHVSLVVTAVQLPIYGLLPQIVLVGIAAAVAQREHSARFGGNLSILPVRPIG